MDSLLSVGLDVGTTSTQLVVSRLTVENEASSFSVPRMTIRSRQVIYRSDVHFTPLLGEELVDGEALRTLLLQEYQKAGVTPGQIDTGAVIITGETSRKENAAAILKALAELAGPFVVTTAGPDLESILAAKGAGAVELSKEISQPVLHVDIGGGTSNLCLVENGEIRATGCLNIGGRLVKLDREGSLSYVSPVLKGLWPFAAGDIPSRRNLQELAELLTRGLAMAAGLIPGEPLLERLQTAGARKWEPPQKGAVLSFSGGVADCIGRDYEDLAFGDLGPVLGRAIRNSSLCAGQFRLGRETIRATVIGAGCHSTQLSGSTVFRQNVALPLRDLPVITVTREELEQGLPALSTKTIPLESPPVIALPPFPPLSFRQLEELARMLAERLAPPYYLSMEQDMALALGSCLAARLGREAAILCLDGIAPGADDYLDVGAPVGPALTVTVKTLILEK